MKGSKIQFAASRFSASAPRRFCLQSFCNGLAAFCNGKSFEFKKSAAIRAASPLLQPQMRTESNVSAAGSESDTAQGCNFRSDKTVSFHDVGAPVIGNDGAQLLHLAQLTVPLTRTEASPRSPGQVVLKVC